MAPLTRLLIFSIAALSSRAQAGILFSEKHSLLQRDDTNTTALLATSTNLSSIVPPSSLGSTISSASVNCSDVSTGLSTKCFAELKLADYVSGFIANTVCGKGEAFVDCYLRQNGYPGLSCGQLSAIECPPPQSFANQDPRAFYTAFNIVALNSFFRQWYDLLHLDVQRFTAIMTQLSSLIDPVVSTKSTLINAAQYNASIETAQSKLNTTAVSILSNVTQFLAYTESGRFSQRLPDVNAVSYMDATFATDLTAKSLNTSGIYLTMGHDINILNLTANGAKLAYPIKCNPDSNSTKLCDAWWYSTETNSSFGLASTSQPQKNLGGLTKALFTNVTSGERLFDAAYACSAKNSGQPIDQISFDITPDKLVDFTCVSKLPIFTWDMACHSTARPDGTFASSDPTPANSRCEFIEGPKKPGFWDQKGDAHVVPPAYLGPALTEGKLKITRN